MRSGKTWVSIVLWILWLSTMPKDGNYIMVGRTLTSLKRNILDLVVEIAGKDNFSYSLAKKEGRLLGRTVFLEGSGDCRSEGKIRGMSLSGAYVDEITLINEDFFAMLLSRLSCENAKLIATTNPDSPFHWLNRKYLSRGDSLDLFTMKFLIDDNPFLPADYVENLKKEYTGVFYDRYILGLWRAAEGLVYPQLPTLFKEIVTDRVTDKIVFAAIGVDFGGNASAHSFVCTGYTENFEKAVVLDEFYIKEKISPTQLEDFFVDFVLKNLRKYRIYDIYCDSAETTLIEGLGAAAAKHRLPVDLRRAQKGRITERIRLTNLLISSGRFQILSHCRHLISAMEEAIWDKSKQEDVRLDNGSSNIDSLDAMEYSMEMYRKDLIRG